LLEKLAENAEKSKATPGNGNISKKTNQKGFSL
jgi:hypothetical protein